MTIACTESLLDQLPETDRALIAAARAVAANAHAPYSKFHVGAAGRYASGETVVGANFENASFGLSLCAETVMIATASAQGRLRELTAVAIFADGDLDGADIGAFIAPCGRCRQILAEAVGLCGRDLDVLMMSMDGSNRVRRTTAKALLPLAFGAG
ncbi:cytidine deaminase [Nevskia sp.]|uniref:cytidine deaminase n=1 Tax=Nevskia sp. TaxID=1929292 RepID=UPI0025F7F23A|nr:cytidine deaminase [Nevskia sp.]